MNVSKLLAVGVVLVRFFFFLFVFSKLKRGNSMFNSNSLVLHS